MQFHSKAQEQALMRLQVQHEIAVAGIKNREKLTEEKKQTALKEELNNFNQKKIKITRFCILIFRLFSIIFSLSSQKNNYLCPISKGCRTAEIIPVEPGQVMLPREMNSSLIECTLKLLFVTKTFLLI